MSNPTRTHQQGIPAGRSIPDRDPDQDPPLAQGRGETAPSQGPRPPRNPRGKPPTPEQLWGDALEQRGEGAGES